MDDDYLYIPTPTQQKVISLLIIPSSILSFIGSSLIIYFVRNEKKTTPYRRILLALSVCDIISTLGWIAQPYLAPSEGSNAYVWAFGNDATCKMLGALTQFGFSAHWYSGALSLYFLLTIRFGMREATFAKKYERWFHLFIILWSVSTSIVGLALGVFFPTDLGPGCWVSNNHGRCSSFGCKAEMIAWIFGGIPTMIILLAIVGNNLVLYCHVRATVMRGQRRAMENEERLSKYNMDESQKLDIEPSENAVTMNRTRSLPAPFEGAGKSRKRSILQSSDQQWKRVRAVGTQSFLYVGAYLLSFGWTSAKQIMDGRGFEQEPGSGKFFLPLLILQSIFLPAQGFFNSIIFFRPKYLQARQKHNIQSRRWCVRRAIFGESVQPVRCSEVVTGHSHESNSTAANKRISFAGEMVSTTSSHQHLPPALAEEKETSWTRTNT
jgi:hypothetical protein